MSSQVTMRFIRSTYRCIAVDYCGLQNLLSYSCRRYYTSGIYGWNADVFIFGNVAIVTGYRPFGNHPDYDVVKDFDRKAEFIRRDTSKTFEQKRNTIEKLINSFIETVTK